MLDFVPSPIDKSKDVLHQLEFIDMHQVIIEDDGKSFLELKGLKIKCC